MCNELADTTEANNTEGLVGEFDACPTAAFPTTGNKRGMSLGNIASHRKQQGHGVLGGRENVRLRRVHDHHATFGGGFGVDVVETDSSATNHDEIGTSSEHLGGDIGGRTDDERVGSLDGLDQLLGAQALLHIDGVASSAKAVEAAISDGFSNKDPCHRGSILTG